MDIVVTGRHTTVSDRFRAHIEEKLAKVPQLAPRVQRIDVMVTHEANRRQAKACDRVEITCRVKGRVIRAEACLEDKYAALDAAMDKLLERLRRINDRKRVHRGRRTPESVAEATARLERSAAADGSDTGTDTAGSDGEGLFGAVGDSPIEVRVKVHASAPMTLEDAVQQMELVGHDFYLFHDSETDKPSVVYRRRGWSYGVLHLEPADPSQESETDETAASAAS
ncbi:conserved hypothetical protein [Nostocoides japonicum T1-X7]|uniref:Ribosome hibernation promoting factor n=1 Tax=Nostocoides japonicum T1-X7 TaxID=1194083 RepID=A0A077LSY3_9MICO|nr:ribosome-associated translation inhibitor RaiA [Tetrasphaera japonica]CCH76016.1 conserved hypothetical protein [Tetrasphaera japonica T1-X7]